MDLVIYKELAKTTTTPLYAFDLVTEERTNPQTEPRCLNYIRTVIIQISTAYRGRGFRSLSKVALVPAKEF